MNIRKNLLISTLVATVLGASSMQGLAFDFKGVLKDAVEKELGQKPVTTPDEAS